MKEETVKIIQIVVEPYVYYKSNGSSYKDEIKSHNIFGLGDDMKIYKFGEHYKSGKGLSKEVGWKEYIPK